MSEIDIKETARQTEEKCNGKTGRPERGQSPRLLDDEAFHCLRSEDLDGFHRHIAGRQEVDFSNCELKGTDFRRADLSKVILSGSHLREADLRGVNLRHMDLEGCSLIHAKISGTYFPENLSAAEIRMSVECGTRLRTGK
jgi:uncharacterized protein YjbI with pentapeptide repeats